MSAARLRSVYAVLLDHFHLSIGEIAALTDRQIHDLYYHQRDDETGQIVMQSPKARADSMENELLTLDTLNAHLSKMGGIKDLEAAKEKVREKWRNKNNGASSPLSHVS